MDTHQKVIAAAALLILGGAVGFWSGRTAERGIAFSPWDLTRPSTEEELELAANGAASGDQNAIAVNDQPPGMSVHVALAALAHDGWVVIHEESDGKPGIILGAQRFAAGTGQTGAVELLRPTEEGRVYFAMLHADDGDRQFDHTKDLPLADPQGNVILMRFVATASPSER